MLQMFTAYWLPQALHTVAKLRIPDRLMEGPRTAAELARDTEMHEDSLRRVLRALSSVGVFSETDEGRFGSTPLSQTLRSDQPDSLWGYLMLVNSDWFWRVLPADVREGPWCPPVPSSAHWSGPGERRWREAVSQRKSWRRCAGACSSGG
ncbi:methyltransferase dimerization domain-containing protein [Corallococcus macrosporus]|nr:methyltransferase dimerization domain-containing protein [Corallococcus macrosporus]